MRKISTPALIVCHTKNSLQLARSLLYDFTPQSKSIGQIRLCTGQKSKQTKYRLGCIYVDESLREVYDPLIRLRHLLPEGEGITHPELLFSLLPPGEGAAGG